MTPLHASADLSQVAPFDELDRVRLKRRLMSDEGNQLEAGWSGTGVAIYGKGEAYCIEFTEPMQALATVTRDDVEAIAEETIARLAPSSPPRRG